MYHIHIIVIFWKSTSRFRKIGFDLHSEGRSREETSVMSSLHNVRWNLVSSGQVMAVTWMKISELSHELTDVNNGGP